MCEPKNSPREESLQMYAKETKIKANAGVFSESVVVEREIFGRRYTGLKTVGIMYVQRDNQFCNN